MKQIIVLIVFFLFSAIPSAGFGGGADRETIRRMDRRNLREFLSIPANGFLTGYKYFIGRARLSTCPMSPSCSRYAAEAVQKHGAVEAFFLTADRLHRCGHDLYFYPLVSTERGYRRYDPVPSPRK